MQADVQAARDRADWGEGFEQPAEIQTRIVEPVLHVGHEGGRGSPGVGAEAADGDHRTWNGVVVAARRGPEVGVEKRVKPGGVARLGGSAAAFLSEGSRGAFPPIRQRAVQADVQAARDRAGHVQLQRDGVDGRAAGDCAGDVEGEESAADSTAEGLAGEEKGALTIAQCAVQMFVERVVLERLDDHLVARRGRGDQGREGQE